jgi:uncharacterized protein YjaG (DUF416 family)
MIVNDCILYHLSLAIPRHEDLRIVLGPEVDACNNVSIFLYTVASDPSCIRMTRKSTTDIRQVEILMQLTQCSIELQNAQECDATDDDSSHSACYIIKKPGL